MSEGYSRGFAMYRLGGPLELGDGIEEKNLIPDFDRIALKNRTTYIVPDNDWLTPDRHGERKNLKQAVYELAYRLIDRGAKVYVIELSEGPEKVGLDDFLCQHSIDEFHSLPKREIRKRTIKEMIEDDEEDYQEILKRLSKRKEGEKDILIKALCKQRGMRVDSVRADLKAMKPASGEINVDRLLELEAQEMMRHSAQTIHDGKLAYGGVFGGEKILRRSDGKIIQEDKNLPFKFSRPKLRGMDIKAFKEGKETNGQDILNRLKRLFSAYVYFKDTRMPILLAVWVIGTYLFKLFRYYGYIILNSPVKGCAKTLVLDILSLVCFNSTNRLVMPSAAVIFRKVDSDDSTLIIDEAETLGGTDQDKVDLIGLLNTGFQSKGVVSRMVGKGTEMKDRDFNTYSPKALAGINKLASTLEDRAFRIVMHKKTENEKIQRFTLRKLDSEVEAIRGNLYAWALRNAAIVEEVYERADEIPGLDKLGDRQRDILEPLLSIASVIDGETEGKPLDTFETLKALAFDMAGAKAERDKALESIPAAIEVITGLMDGQEELFIVNTTLLEEMRKNDTLGFLETTTKLAGFMRKLDVYHTQKRVEGEKKRGYIFKREQVEDWGRRYL